MFPENFTYTAPHARPQPSPPTYTAPHPRARSTAVNDMNLPAGSALGNDLLKSGYKSDFTIECGNTSFEVHQAFIATGSQYFAALFRNNFMENEERRVVLKDDDPKTIYQLLSYIYTGEYPILLDVSAETNGTAKVTARNHQLQDYWMDDKFCVRPYQEHIREALHGLVLLAHVAQKHSCSTLANFVVEDFKNIIHFLHIRPVHDGMDVPEVVASPEKNLQLIKFVLEETMTLSVGPDLRAILAKQCILQNRLPHGISRDRLNEEIAQVVKEAEPVAWALGNAFFEDIEQLVGRNSGKGPRAQWDAKAESKWHRARFPDCRFPDGDNDS